MPNHLISPEGLKRLTEYKYISHTPSLLERALSKWWELAITFVPMVNQPHFPHLMGFFTKRVLLQTQSLWLGLWR